jgi:hypothetical protein
MSYLRVNNVTDQTAAAAPTFSKGLEVSANKSINSNNVNVVGIFTAGSFSGNGSGITNVAGVSVGRCLSLNLIN